VAKKIESSFSHTVPYNMLIYCTT